MADSPIGGPTDPLPRQPIDPAAYERRSRQGPCVVCQTLAGNPDYPGHFVWTDDHAVAFLARYNTLLGHTLVAPRTHREQVTADFRIQEYLALQRLVYQVGEAIRQELPTERLYILSLGSQSGNRHVHWHVAPLPPGVPSRSSSSPPSPGTAASLRCLMMTWRISPNASALASKRCSKRTERGATSGPHPTWQQRTTPGTAATHHRSSAAPPDQQPRSSDHPGCL